MANVKFKQWDCVLQKAKYSDGDRVVLVLLDANSNVVIAKATVNMPEIDLQDNEILIKDY